jgi:hypothetical protein
LDHEGRRWRSFHGHDRRGPACQLVKAARKRKTAGAHRVEIDQDDVGPKPPDAQSRRQDAIGKTNGAESTVTEHRDEECALMAGLLHQEDSNVPDAWRINHE